MDQSVLIVIPARMESTRFPGKPLAKIAGTAMLERVWRIAQSVESEMRVNDVEARVVVATDSEEIKKFAESFGAEALLTSKSCQTGTDRVAEVAERIAESYDLVFSFQGDAVLMPPSILSAVVNEMCGDESVQIATPAVRLTGEARQRFVEEKRKGSTTGTSVVLGSDNKALYFSKGLIPFPRDGEVDNLPLHLHIGLYGYRREVLKQFTELPQSPLESVEKLEQLRALENGITIQVVVVDTGGRSLHSVDSPEDLLRVEEIIEREGELLS